MPKTGTSAIVRDILARNPDITAGEAVAALPDHNPNTVRTQLARQRHAAPVPVAAPVDVSTLNLHKVWLDADAAISDAATAGLPKAPYVFIVLRSGHDARIIEGKGARSASEKLRSIKSPGGVTDHADNAWIREQGGVMALIFTAA
ncbi:hypothetical protein [Mesorhizobium onobrychidis]|uniref:Uncharacterized protein n=1 Tax=Mesorhizobium onobrychidis TaxID=2775404 RepID=A0ABY5R951_9HYPH|nr:hypothetical protein [Mesorhizobium onobrychidis]UVC19331.1 hypothetical protein IHQ72_36110 [Mesorhizobium onobrychidis]